MIIPAIHVKHNGIRAVKCVSILGPAIRDGDCFNAGNFVETTLQQQNTRVKLMLTRPVAGCARDYNNFFFTAPAVLPSPRVLIRIFLNCAIIGGP